MVAGFYLCNGKNPNCKNKSACGYYITKESPDYDLCFHTTHPEYAINGGIKMVNMDAKEAANHLRIFLERGGSDGFSQEEKTALNTAIKILDMDILNTPILELMGAQYELGYEAGKKFAEGH